VPPVPGSCPLAVPEHAAALASIGRTSNESERRNEAMGADYTNSANGKLAIAGRDDAWPGLARRRIKGARDIVAALEKR